MIKVYSLRNRMEEVFVLCHGGVGYSLSSLLLLLRQLS